jgi:hypothetical protein
VLGAGLAAWQAFLQVRLLQMLRKTPAAGCHKLHHGCDFPAALRFLCWAACQFLCGS